jgi:hypothetical protein
MSTVDAVLQHLYLIVKLHVKVKFSLEHAMKARREGKV